MQLWITGRPIHPNRPKPPAQRLPGQVMSILATVIAELGGDVTVARHWLGKGEQARFDGVPWPLLAERRVRYGA
jgi:hypothetical protein